MKDHGPLSSRFSAHVARARMRTSGRIAGGRGPAPHLCLAALTAGLCWILSSCMLDFNEAIPCVTSDQCPEDMVCDSDFQRCAKASSDDEPIDEDDTGVRPGRDTTPPVDTGPDDADAAPDDVIEPPVDIGEDDAIVVPPDTDNGEDTLDVDPPTPCVPREDFCPPADPECEPAPEDDVVICGPDDPIPDPGPGPVEGDCGEGETRVEHPSGPYCIDTYEASRPDATASSAGDDNSRATSRAGVIPWGFATFTQAEAACTAAGKRLCNPAEWEYACAGPDTWSYPYHSRLYENETCNGLNVDPRTSAATTGQFPGCVSPTGVVDLSGNVGEWTNDRRARGGAFNAVSTNLRCNSVNASVNPEVGLPEVGFRCCRDPS